MLIVISPAKRLNLEPQKQTKNHTLPDFLDQSQTLVERLRKFSRPQLASLMGISDNLADENYERYIDWHTPFTPDNAKPALLKFDGDVYTSLEAETFKKREFDFAQKHLRILSGLYGSLRPLDLIQAYRLEMGTKLSGRGWNNLYDFWGAQIAESLNDAFPPRESRCLVNLASNEYFKAVDKKVLDGEVITPAFKEEKSGKLRVVSVFAKKARGLMTGFLIRNRITDPEHIKTFNLDGYRYNPRESTERNWVFSRRQP